MADLRLWFWRVNVEGAHQRVHDLPRRVRQPAHHILAANIKKSVIIWRSMSYDCLSTGNVYT